MQQHMRKWLKRGLVTALVVLPVWFVVTAVHEFLTADPFPPRPTRCTKVEDYAGGRIPEEATDVKCLDTSGWQDTSYTAEFRMPRKDVAARLVRAFPRAGIRHGQVDKQMLPPSAQNDSAGGEASSVYIDIAYEGTDTALVKLEALTP
ncbi:hypothetical protein GCM10010218_62540 [Streptomyces mashuensis]|uniref:Uncharacterized protein n=1 Tax=Streptomyces mashuensis TaxID=33904 RepID=A0A919B9M4_9ACTN|nr:hypothetical protein [Streptomyces mashuensis]GHF72834.1 hypothetical protein GCM10010218_62540 [Streptomyces mashuensis]